MDISKQVCTLEQAKRLKELGVAQGKSAFAFIKNKCHDEIKFRLRMVLMEGVSYEGYEDWEGGCLQGYSAFTVAELGEMLPAGCQSNYNDHHGYWVCDWPEVWDEEDEPNARPYAVPGWKITAEIDDEEMQTEAQVRAAMLIHLIENKLITIEEKYQQSKSPKREWEIVAFGEREDDAVYYYDLQPEGNYKSRSNPGTSLRWPLCKFNGSNGFIHSVRRLSDGEVFSVGDSFLSGGGLKEKITSFEIHDHDMWVLFSCGSNNLQYIKKLPQPILTTVDGVEIFDLDNFRPTVLFDDGSMNPNAGERLWRNGVEVYNGKLFSSKEAAEKYLLNMISEKPLLSLNDVKRIPDYDDHNDLMAQLTAIVKQKLKQ